MTKTKTVSLLNLKRKLAKLWRKEPQEWKRYHQIRDYLKQSPEFNSLSERTIIRYLNHLMKIGFLEKKIEPTHRTWYKPKNIELQREELKQIIDEIENEKLLLELKAARCVEPIYKIIAILEEGELSTKHISEKLNISESKLTEYLSKLENIGLVTETEKGCWKLSFEGLLAVINFSTFDVEQTEKIAKNYPESWLIFQEWEKLTSDEETRDTIFRGVKYAAMECSFFPLYEPTALLNMLEESSKDDLAIWKELERHIAPHRKRKATLIALYFEESFEAIHIPWLYDRKHKIYKLWNTCAKIPSIRKFILEQLRLEEKKYENLKRFKAFFKQLAKESNETCINAKSF